MRIKLPNPVVHYEGVYTRAQWRRDLFAARTKRLQKRIRWVFTKFYGPFYEEMTYRDHPFMQLIKES